MLFSIRFYIIDFLFANTKLIHCFSPMQAKVNEFKAAEEKSMKQMKAKASNEKKIAEQKAAENPVLPRLWGLRVLPRLRFPKYEKRKLQHPWQLLMFTKWTWDIISRCKRMPELPSNTLEATSPTDLLCKLQPNPKMEREVYKNRGQKKWLKEHWVTRSCTSQQAIVLAWFSRKHFARGAPQASYCGAAWGVSLALSARQTSFSDQTAGVPGAHRHHAWCSLFLDDAEPGRLLSRSPFRSCEGFAKTQGWMGSGIEICSNGFPRTAIGWPMIYSWNLRNAIAQDYESLTRSAWQMAQEIAMLKKRLGTDQGRSIQAAEMMQHVKSQGLKRASNQDELTSNLISVAVQVFDKFKGGMCVLPLLHLEEQYGNKRCLNSLVKLHVLVTKTTTQSRDFVVQGLYDWVIRSLIANDDITKTALTGNNNQAGLIALFELKKMCLDFWLSSMIARAKLDDGDRETLQKVLQSHDSYRKHMLGDSVSWQGALKRSSLDALAFLEAWVRHSKITHCRCTEFCWFVFWRPGLDTPKSHTVDVLRSVDLFFGDLG